MFIEELREEDFACFCRCIHSELDSVDIKKDALIIVFKNNVYPNCAVTDFRLWCDTAEVPVFEKILEKKWRKFMLLHFGENYKNALFSYLDEQLKKQKEDLTFTSIL